jgi:transcriptional regulator with XRE-family HTH domain
VPANKRQTARRPPTRKPSHARAGAAARPNTVKASDGLGPRLRQARERNSITVRDLARRINVSPSLVSQVERGRAMPSVGTLLAIANELGLDIGALFKPGAQRYAHGLQAAANPVQRRGSRKAIRMASGVRWERLTVAPEPEVEFLYAVYEVGSASCAEDSMLRHGGKEYAYLLSGRLGVKIGFEEYELGPGDAISFDAQMPHRLWCIGSQPAVAIWTIIRREGDARQSRESMTGHG